MGTPRLLICLAVIAGTLAKSDDGNDLNLKSIFRTPRDFSKVNFDHFELLERNNFNDEDKESRAEKKEVAKSDDRLSRSLANAQVMLRIGGEDIHDCNRVILHHPPTIKENNYYSEQPQHTQQQQQQVYNNDARYQYYSHPYSTYPYVHQPISFPGYYYNPNPLQNYLHSSYQPVSNQLAQSELAAKSPQGTTTLSYIEDDCNSLPATERLVEVTRETPGSQIILEKPTSYETQIKTETIHLSRPHVEEKIVVNQEPVHQEAVVETCSSSTEESTVHESSTANPICVTTSHAEPLHTKVEFVETNVGTTEKSVEPKEGIHLIEEVVEPLPTERTQESVVVSQPEVHVQEHTISSAPEQEVVVSQASSDSCNRERDSSIPYGHRFSKDVDSLHEIIDNGLHNEEHSVRIANVEAPVQQRQIETVSTSVPAEEDSNSQTLVHDVVSHYPKNEVVVTHEPVEQRYVTQEVVHHSGPKTITKIETPCETNTVITERRPYQPSAELSSQNVHVQPSSSTQSEYTTQELVRVSNPQPSASSNCQNRVVETTHEVPYTQEVVQEVNRVNLPEVIESSDVKEVRAQNPILVKGYNSKGNPQLSIDLSRFNNDRPKVIIEDYEDQGRSGYNSDPIRSIVYRQPLFLDALRSSSSSFPVVERVRYIEPYRELVETSQLSHAPIREHVRIVNPFSSLLESYRSAPVRHYVQPHRRISEPHIYKIVPKFDIIPRRDIRPLHIPDLVPTNQFLKVNVPHRQVYHREYLHVDKTPVSRHEYQVRKSTPFWKNISVQREVQSAPACKPCSRYSAELDELC